MASNINKANKDWERKIVLPEVKRAFKARFKLVLEQNGKIPKNFLAKRGPLKLTAIGYRRCKAISPRGCGFDLYKYGHVL